LLQLLSTQEKYSNFHTGVPGVEKFRQNKIL